MKQTPLFLLLFAGMGLAALGQTPLSKPNFSGTWIFNAQKSALKVSPPSSVTLKIEQNDPQVKLARTQVYGDQSFPWKLEIVADGQKEVVETSPLYTANIRMYWEGNSLVLDEKITASDGTKASDMVTYSLSDDGKTLSAMERENTAGAKKPTMNKWVYDKQAQ